MSLYIMIGKRVEEHKGWDENGQKEQPEEQSVKNFSHSLPVFGKVRLFFFVLLGSQSWNSIMAMRVWISQMAALMSTERRLVVGGEVLRSHFVFWRPVCCCCGLLQLHDRGGLFLLLIVIMRSCGISRRSSVQQPTRTQSSSYAALSPFVFLHIVIGQWAHPHQASQVKEHHSFGPFWNGSIIDVVQVQHKHCQDHRQCGDGHCAREIYSCKQTEILDSLRMKTMKFGPFRDEQGTQAGSAASWTLKIALSRTSCHQGFLWSFSKHWQWWMFAQYPRRRKFVC